MINTDRNSLGCMNGRLTFLTDYELDIKRAIKYNGRVIVRQSSAT